MILFKHVFRLYKQAYSGLPREAWLLSLVEFINRCGYMVFIYMTLYLTQTFNFSTLQASQVISSYGFGALLGAYIGGKLTDVIGAYNVQKASLLLAGILFIVLGHLTSFWLIMTVMFLAGLVGEALHPANATAMSQVCPPELRTRGFALNRLATNLGITFGPLIGGYLALINYSWLFWIDGFTCILAAAIFMWFFRTARPPLEPHAESQINTPSVWKDFYFLKILVFTFLMGIVFVQLFNTFPLYFRSVYGFKENHIGILLAINTVVIVLFEMILIDRLKKKSLIKIIARGAFLLCLGFALMPLGRGFLFAAFTVIVWTMGEMLALPALTALIANHSDDAVRGKYMGMFSFAFALAIAVGPAIGGKIYDSLGPNALWFGCGVMGVLLWLAYSTLKPVKVVKPSHGEQSQEATD